MYFTFPANHSTCMSIKVKAQLCYNTHMYGQFELLRAPTRVVIRTRPDDLPSKCYMSLEANVYGYSTLSKYVSISTSTIN